MGFLSDLLKLKSVPEAQAKASLDVLERVKQRRGPETGQWLALIVDPSKIPAPNAPSTMQDLDQLETIDNTLYTPPPAAAAEETDSLLAGINFLFDELAQIAGKYDATVQDQNLLLGMQRPVYTQDVIDGTTMSVLAGSLYSQHWGLFFFAHGNAVEIHMLPFDRDKPWSLSALRQSQHQPLTIIPATLKAAEIPKVTSDLFNDLIRVDSGNISHETT